MNTNSVPLSTHVDQIALSNAQLLDAGSLLKESMAHFAAVLKRSFLPHLLGGIGFFLLVAYVTASFLLISWENPLKWVVIFILLSLYGMLAFGYSLFTSCVFALRLACIEWNDLIDNLLGLVQERAAYQLADMNVGLTKTEATRLVKGSVREVFSSVKSQQTGVPRGIVILCLGLMAAAVRAVLAAKIVKWSGKTIQLGKLFAGRATLVGAIFLNLHLFATLLLVCCYALGAAVLALNIYFVILLK